MADAYLLLALTNSCKHNMRQHQLRVNPSLYKHGECQSHVLYSPQTKDTRYFLISRAVIAMVCRENMLMHFTAMFFSCSISAQWKAKQQSFFLERSVSHINTPLLFPSEIPQKLFTSAFLCCCNQAVGKLSLWQWLKTKNNWFCLSKSSLRRGAQYSHYEGRQTDSRQSGLQPGRYTVYINTISRWKVWILWNPTDLALLRVRVFSPNALNCGFFLSIPKTCSKELTVITRCELIKNPREFKRQKVACVSLHLCFTCFKRAVPPPKVTGINRIQNSKS